MLGSRWLRGFQLQGIIATQLDLTINIAGVKDFFQSLAAYWVRMQDSRMWELDAGLVQVAMGSA